MQIIFHHLSLMCNWNQESGYSHCYTSYANSRLDSDTITRSNILKSVQSPSHHQGAGVAGASGYRRSLLFRRELTANPLTSCVPNWYRRNQTDQLELDPAHKQQVRRQWLVCSGSHYSKAVSSMGDVFGEGERERDF